MHKLKQVHDDTFKVLVFFSLYSIHCNIWLLI